MTELAAPQISSLMEALPGIAAVLRSPIANAIVALSRAAAGLEEFDASHAEELLRFGVRRNLLTQDEVDTVLAEIRVVVAGRPKKIEPVVEKAKKLPPKPAATLPFVKAIAAAAPVAAAVVAPKVAAAPPPPNPPPPMAKVAAAKPAVKAAVKAPVKPAPKPTPRLVAKPVAKAALAKPAAKSVAKAPAKSVA